MRTYRVEYYVPTRLVTVKANSEESAIMKFDKRFKKHPKEILDIWEIDDKKAQQEVTG